MVHYIGKRLLIIIPLLLVLSVVVFVLIQLPPGDYLTSYINTLRAQGGNIDQDTIQQLEMRYGLDQPMYIQYFKWMGRMFQGDFGYSFQWNRPVNELLADRLPCTIALSFTSILLVWIIALPIGFYSATHKYSPLDYGFTTISFLGMSLPDFLLALIVLWLYYAATGTFGGGLYSDAFVNQPFSFAKFVDLLKHVWMPYLVIAITSTAGLIKTFRANLLDEMSKPYVQTARAKGVSNLRLLIKYPVRIAMIPFVGADFRPDHHLHRHESAHGGAAAAQRPEKSGYVPGRLHCIYTGCADHDRHPDFGHPVGADRPQDPQERVGGRDER